MIRILFHVPASPEKEAFNTKTKPGKHLFPPDFTFSKDHAPPIYIKMPLYCQAFLSCALRPAIKKVLDRHYGFELNAGRK